MEQQKQIDLEAMLADMKETVGTLAAKSAIQAGEIASLKQTIDAKNRQIAEMSNAKKEPEA